jgi:hypothetical protein
MRGVSKLESKVVQEVRVGFVVFAPPDIVFNEGEDINCMQ